MHWAWCLMARDDRVLRPFWLHQVAEYLIGLALVAMGLQSPDPLVPTVAGGLIVINAAMVDGPLGAFRAVSRRTHRTIDLVLIIGLVVAAVLPWGVDNASRIMMLIVAAVLAVVWWNSAFTRRAPADPGPPGRPHGGHRPFRRPPGRSGRQGDPGSRQPADR